MFLIDTKTNEYTRKIQNEGFKIKYFNSCRSKEEWKHLQKQKTDWLVIDRRNVDQARQKQAKQLAKNIMIIDDSLSKKMDCDIYVNQNYGIKKNQIKKFLVSKKTQICAGPIFAMVGSEYLSLKEKYKTINESIKKIVIFLSYGNHSYILSKVLTLIKQNSKKKLKLYVISNSGKKKIFISTKKVKIKVYKFIHHMAPLLFKSDLAIGALGMSTWERFCLGVPSLIFALSEEQKKLLIPLAKNKFCKYLGSGKTVRKKALSEALNKPYKNQLLEMSAKGRKLVDGLGCRRLALKLILFNKQINVRKVVKKDELKLYKLVNDPLVRKNSFNQKRITRQEHHKWFLNKISNKKHCSLFCIESTTGTFLGQVRLDFINKKWRIDFSIIPEARGNGIAKQMLAEAMRKTCNKTRKNTFFSVVKNENQPSLNTFRSLNFKHVILANKTFFYKKIS